MPKKLDESNTKMTMELETFKGKKDETKNYEGIRIRIGDVTRVIFVTPNELTYVKKVLDANGK